VFLVYQTVITENPIVNDQTVITEKPLNTDQKVVTVNTESFGIPKDTGDWANTEYRGV